MRTDFDLTLNGKKTVAIESFKVIILKSKEPIIQIIHSLISTFEDESSAPGV